MQSDIQIRRNGDEEGEIVMPNRFKDSFLMGFDGLGRFVSVVPDIKDVDYGIG